MLHVDYLDHQSLSLAAGGNPTFRPPQELTGSGGAGAGTGADGGAGGAANGGPNGGAGPSSPMGGPNFLLLIFVVLGAMIIFSMFGQRRDRKKRDQMLSAIKKHDKVQTIGGVIGSIVDVKKETVVLKVDESSNTRLTVTRSAIQQVLSGQPSGAAMTAPPAPAPSGTGEKS